MHYRYIHYNLECGFIHNWLIGGPQAISVEIENCTGDEVLNRIAQKLHEPESGITKTPVERGPLTKGLFQVGDYEGSWSYFACREDHLVDHSGFYPSPHYLRSWAYCQIASKDAQDVSLVLTTHGPADVWLNGEHIHHQEHFYAQQPGSEAFLAHLAEGANKIMVRFENVALLECAHAMALQVCKPIEGQPAIHAKPYPTKSGIHIRIPSLVQAIARRNTFEQVASTAYITQDIFEGPGPIQLHWPVDLEESSYTTVRLQAITGQTYAEADVDGTAGDKLFLGYPFQIPEGAYRIVLMPRPWEVYEVNTRISREIPLWTVGMDRYSATPYGTYAERRQEALQSAARRKGLFAEIAKMASGTWTALDIDVILEAARNVTPLNLLGLLGIVYRFSEHSEFPAGLLNPLEECILGYPYNNSIKGVPIYELAGNEGQKIIDFACEILAGQYYPKRKFHSGGKTGQWHRKNGEQFALEWFRQRGATGFSDWDSTDSFAVELSTLSHLADLAKSEPIWEMASVVMDKLFLTIAMNSYQGVFGSTHGRTYAPFVKGGLLDPTSGITRLMWGSGIFNHHIAGYVSLACVEKYELPSIITNIAVSESEEIWSKECHARYTGRVVNKVTYKTPDTMLCSAQNYYPGEKGRMEHIWQATLGVGATVFVNHPACSNENDARQPNFWAGNAILPRVAQWKDTLIGVYHLPEDDWMGFTHAYFPTYAFDEYAIRDGWAFAHKGEGYLALKASQGFNLIQRGLYAFTELRAYGQDNIWLCQMGRAAIDGDFTTFQRKVLALAVKFEGQSIRFTTLRGEALSFGWQDPFIRDGQEQPLSGFMHYENPFTTAGYPCSQMEVQYGEDLMRLDFGNVSR
jgi:hypothetical protein